MQSTIRFEVLLLSCLLLGTFEASFAATDGAVGATSVGTVRISLFVPQQVRLAGLDEVRIEPSRSGRGAIGVARGCVFRTANADFRIMGFGSGAQRTFTLTDGRNTRRYEASVSHGQRQQPIAKGIAVNGHQSADQQSADCGGVGYDLALGVALPGVPLDDAPYTGILTLVVSPN